MADDEDITIKSADREQQQEVTEQLAASSFGLTDIGNKRLHNEDAFLASDERQLWVVADGMGGHNAGDFASRTIIDALEEFQPASDLRETANKIESIIRQTNTELIDSATELKSNTIIGSTVLFFTVQGSEGIVGWAGDSRIYRIRSSEIERLTQDHSLVNEMLAKGMISADEAETHPESNKITRAVGFQDEIRLELRTVKVLPEDRYILCTDGLTKELEDNEILRNADPHVSSENVCNQLLQLALHKEARDNVTIVTVDFSQA